MHAQILYCLKELRDSCIQRYTIKTFQFPHYFQDPSIVRFTPALERTFVLNAERFNIVVLYIL